MNYQEKLVAVQNPAVPGVFSNDIILPV